MLTARERIPLLALLLAAIAVSGGCLEPAPLALESGISATASPVVIAFIDSGINPYHGEFSLAPAESRNGFKTTIEDARTGLRVVPLTLSSGLDYAEALARDAPSLERVQSGILYDIIGTNILAIQFDTPTPDDPPLVDASGHGTMVAGIASRSAPGVVVVAIEAAARPCLPQDGRACTMLPAVTTAMEWVADQPWIDVVSLSFTIPGNPPNPELDAFAAAMRRAVAFGKVVVAAGGNVPPPALAGGINSPPWVISVSGAQEASRGAAVLAAASPDVVANYSWPAPDHASTNGTYEGAGTSLAAPRVAGVLAKAIAEVRASWGHRGGIVDGALAVSPAGERASAWDFRAALNASARVWNATDWSPAEPREDPVATAIRSTVPVTSPAAQMGWGFVDNATAHEVAARVLARDFALPAAKEGAHRAGVEGAYAARVAYWSRALGS